MKIIECGTGYTSIPAQMGAATEIVVEELAKSFSKRKINYQIFDVEDENRAPNALNIKEIKLNSFLRKKDTTLGIIHKLKRVFYSLNLAKELRNEIKHSKENIVIHFHNQYNMYFFLKTTPKKYLKNIKLYYTVHSYIWNNDWNKISSTVKKKYFQEIYCVKNADKVFVLNNITFEHFKKQLNIASNKIVKIDNGVNIDIYKPLNNSKKNDFIFFQSGSVCERKNQLGAIEHLCKFLKNNECKYLFAGGIIDQEYKNQIDKFALNNNIRENIIYAGELKPGTELNKYYNKATAFIFPSHAEAFSLVILEALSCGLPVIMDRQSIKDIDSNLESVILFYNNQEEFDLILNKTIFDEEERKKLAINSRKIIEEKYSWDAIANMYLEEFTNDIK